MELNSLERRFFDDVLNVKLDEPTHATISSLGTSVDVIAIPKIHDNGQFILEYYNAPANQPEKHSDGTRSLAFDEITHPSLRMGNSVKVQLKTQPSFPFPTPAQPLLSATVRFSSTNRGVLTLNEGIVEVAKSLISRAEFYVGNLPSMAIPLMPLKEQPIVLNSHGWKITLRGDCGPRDTTGYMGVVERLDRTQFTSGRLLKLLQAWTYFLCFVTGTSRAPTVVLGYGDTERAKPIWGKLGSFDSKYPDSNWFSNPSGGHSTSFFGALFTKFYSKWQCHSENIRSLAQRYEHGRAVEKIGSFDTALIISFSGLEALAIAILSAEGKCVPREASKKINKAIREVRRRCNHDIGMVSLNSAETPELCSLSKDLGVRENGPWLLSKARNYAVHFGDRLGDVRFKKLAESEEYYLFLHDLSQFYFEYMFLAYLDFPDVEPPRALLTGKNVIVS